MTDKKETKRTEKGGKIYEKTGTVHFPVQLDLPGLEHLKKLGAQSEHEDSYPLALDGVSGNPHIELMIAQVMDEAFELFKRKHKDYGAENLARFGVQGLIIRLSDKMSRLEHVFKNNGNLVEDETLRDTFMDIANYAIAAVIMQDENWR